MGPPILRHQNLQDSQSYDEGPERGTHDVSSSRGGGGGLPVGRVRLFEQLLRCHKLGHMPSPEWANRKTPAYTTVSVYVLGPNRSSKPSWGARAG
jgi:hypothetical protein